MSTDIVKTKYIVANETGISHLQEIVISRTKERFSDKASRKQFEKYCRARFSTETIISDLNDFSNQCVLVFSGEKPAGFAYFSDKVEKPESLSGKKAKHIMQFEVLDAFKNFSCAQSLLEKCINIATAYDALWIVEPVHSTFIPLFELNVFTKQKPVSHWNGLPVESVILIRDI